MKRSRIRRRAAAALLSGASCLALSAAYWHAVSTAADAVRRGVAALPGASAGAVSVDLLRGRVAVDALTVGRPGLRVSIGRLTLSLPALARPALVPSAMAQAATPPTGAALADNVRIDLGTAIVTIPHLEAKGTTLDGTQLAAIFDSGQPDSLEDRLARLSASSLDAPEVRLSQAGDAPDQKRGIVTVRAVHLADVVAGRIGALSADGATVLGNDAPGESGTLETGRIAARSVDVPLAVKIVKGSRTDPAAPLETLYESFSVAAIKFVETAPETEAFEIGSMEGSGVKGRPLLVPFKTLSDMMDKPVEDRSPEERQRVADLTVDAMRSVSLGHLALHDIAFAQSGSDKPTSLKIGTIALEGDDVLKIGKFAIDQVSVASPDITASLAHFGIDGWDQTGLLDAIKQIGGLPFGGSGMAQMQALVPKVSKVSLGSLHVEAPAKALDGNSADGGHYVFDVPMVAIDVGGYAGAMATDATSRVQFIYDIAPTVPNPGLRAVADAGFTHFDLTSETVLHWNAGKQTFQLDRVSVAAKDLAALALNASLSNVSPDVFGTDQDAQARALQQIRIESVELGLANQNLADKVLPLLATQADMTVPAFKTDLKLKLHQAVLEALGETPAADQIVRAASAFIDSPQTFDLKVVAPHGIGMQDVAGLQDPKDIQSLLDITATANK